MQISTQLMQYNTRSRRSTSTAEVPRSWEEALLTEVQNTRFGVFLVNVQDGEVTFIEKVVRRRIEVLKGEADAEKRHKRKK